MRIEIAKGISRDATVIVLSDKERELLTLAAELVAEIREKAREINPKFEGWDTDTALAKIEYECTDLADEGEVEVDVKYHEIRLPNA